MFRKTVWKNTVSDAVSWHQDEALNTTMFILKEYGPTGFLLKEEGEPKNFKVFLGDPHTCTCSTFHKERDLCKHICWVLLRKFRLPREHEYCFQQVLVERQILELLQGLHRSRTPRPVHPPCSEADPNPRPDPAEGDGGVRQKEIEAEDVCPICQEELLGKRLPVSYCRFGCGNNVHISCMKVWADHQARPEGEGEAMVKCPLCREDFGPVKLLLEQVRNVAKLHTAAERERPDRHLGVLCNNCRVCPITGKCFKCTVCRYYHLCEDCIRRCCHPQHAFAIRTKRTAKWLSLGQRVFNTLGEPREMTTQSVGDSMIPVESDPLPEHLVRSLLSVRVRRGCPLLDPGQQCRICLKSFQQGQQARHLPCHHRFHTDCVDPLLRRSNSCPLDGYVIYNPLTWSSGGGKGTPKLASSLDHPKLSEQHRLELFVPGVALLDRAARVVPSLSMFSSEGSADTLVPLPQDTMVVGLQGLSINTVNIESMEGGKSRTEKDGSPVKSVILNKSLSSQHLRTDVSRVRLGRTKSSSSTKSLAQNNATSTNRLGGVSGGTGRAQPSLFVGVNRSDMTAAAAQTRAVITLWRARPQWKRRPRVPRPSTGDSQQATGLRMTGVLINAPHQGEKEHKCDTLMDMDSIEGLNEVRPAVYRTAMKLRSLQKLCHMHVVTLRELIPALCSLGGARDTGAGLSEQEVRQCINRMFQSVSQEVPGQVSAEVPEQTCRLMYRLFDRGQSGAVCRRSVEAALISLSADTLSAKHKALVHLAERCSGRESGTVSRSGLRVVLQDLSQVPAVVQENHVFGSAETAVRSCFSGVLSACVCEEHVLSWLQCEPCLLLWLPTLYRLSVSENVTHSVRCHTCKAYPITGLRYRCMKCVNLHLCQTCFLTERHTKKHKSSHPVLEHCTQPSWKESLASLAYSARHALLPRRYTHREAERRRCLIRAESRGEPQTSFTTPDPSPQSAAEDTPPDDRAPPTNPPQLLATPSAVRPRKASKALQTEEEQEAQQEAQPQRRDSVLIKDIKDLQRDKWLLERELQVWRVTVQSEQGSLEYRCSEMEANMETLRQHNLRLQDMMSQALSMSGTHADIMPHANVIPHAKYRPERDIACPVESQSSASSSGFREREEEEEREEEDECCTAKMQRNEMKTEEQRGDDDEEEEQTETDSVTETHTPTITSNPQPCDGQVTGPMKDQSVSEEEYSGMCSLAEEERLCELVQRLISELSLHTYSLTDCRQELELLEAAEEVGDSVCHLVYAVNTHSVPNTHTSCPILLHNHRPEYVSKRLL